jgi:hypothetical protein
MAFLYGRAGRLTAKNAGFRPGQRSKPSVRAATCAHVGFPYVPLYKPAHTLLLQVAQADLAQFVEFTASYGQEGV